MSKKYSELKEKIWALEDAIDRIRRNGLETAVAKLNQEVNTSAKQANIPSWQRLWLQDTTVENAYEPTLAGKVDAIIEYLGINIGVEYKKSSKKVTVSKKVVKKASKK